ncbi:MAG: sensor histidine kinase [Nitrospiria bacterium]
MQLKNDRTRLLQCILNYLSNAVKFTERGQITITAEAVGQGMQICVRDTGMGIQKEDMPKLFTPFTRLNVSGKSAPPGTGLGLYLTRKLAEEVLGGSVAVESEHGKGSTFILNLPMNVQVSRKEPGT